MYDPALAPRYLPPGEIPLSEAEREEVQGRISEIDRRMRRLSLIRELFNDEGWPVLQSWLGEQIEIARQALTTLREHGDIRWVQGQVDAFDRLRQLPRMIDAEYQHRRDQLAELGELEGG